ncbi:general transcription factor II-I repeat domain-containing protein 2B-like [Triplophysa dalaica]|uniref:general transcription factor II-I repeat domain-containing protein 2B-like n=1 Tax=Triplophysa dalaica TaxID=1582913 RepID=UPI0024DF4FE4|nr:general transcription factor II-I repeat domain-containing protein 2B-like [Triplophysa dalaica]
MAEDIGEQIKVKAAAFSAFSIACDESTDISDSAQLLVFLRGVNEDFEVTQELAGTETVSGTTKGEDLFLAVEHLLKKNELKWKNMAGITTDGAPAMVGKKCGLATLVSQKVHECGGKVVKYHCIVHQEQLCAKSIGLVDVMREVVKIVNNIRSKALTHRQFKALLDEMDAQYGDVLYHQEVRWLSRGKVLKRFFDLRDEIRAFKESKNSNFQVPMDQKWLSDLAFLVDITELLNVLNVQLQIITQLFDHVKAFKQKLLLLKRHLSAGILAHFPCLKEAGMMKEKLPEYDAVLSNLIQEFDRRFEDFRNSAADFELFSQPFTISVDTVSDDLQMELIDLQCDSELKHKFRSQPLIDFYKCVPANWYPKMCKQAQVMLSLFGSTYICEQTFSLMNLNKCKLRSSLTDSHLHNVLTLSVSQLQPNLEKLLKNKDQLHVSH